MLISQKCRYALRAVFELGLRNSLKPAKTPDIATAQHIPVRFLEVIMGELRNGGFVESRRGKKGGYLILRDINKLTVGEVISYIQGPLDITSNGKSDGDRGDYAFKLLWQKVSSSVSEVYANTTFAELIELEAKCQNQYVPDYSI